MSSSYLDIARDYEARLERHGDTHLGVGWPNAEDVPTRHAVMLDVIRAEDHREPVRLLDVGCGASALYEHLRERDVANVEYAGLDVSEKFVELSRRKFPGNDYYRVDLLAEDATLPRFDYAVMNGVFTVKAGLAFEEMFSFVQRMLTSVFAMVDRGMAFNVMSMHVDWEREDLFHLPLDALAAFLVESVSRHFVVRYDYGLYEYTTYVYRSPVESQDA